MQRLFNALVSCYWCAAFAMLGMAPGALFGEGFAVPLNEFGQGIADTPLASVAGVAALLTVSAAVLTASLFLWTVLLAAFDDLDDMRSVASLAFSMAAGVGVVLMLSALPLGQGNHSLLWMVLQAVALVASWLAVSAGRLGQAAERLVPLDAPAQTMARDAARELMATRLSRRIIEPREEIG